VIGRANASFRVTVALGRNPGTVYMCNGTHFRLVKPRRRAGCDPLEESASAGVVHPLDQNSLAAARLEGWPGYTPAVSPLPSRREIPVQRGCELGHFDPIVRQLDLAIRGARARTLAVSKRGYGQRIDESRQRHGIQHLTLGRLFHPMHGGSGCVGLPSKDPARSDCHAAGDGRTARRPRQREKLSSRLQHFSCGTRSAVPRQSTNLRPSRACGKELARTLGRVIRAFVQRAGRAVVALRRASSRCSRLRCI